MIGEQPVVVILDEFPYAVESDPSLPSHLQAVWDHHLKDKSLTLILAGSHIGMMGDLLQYQAPLYGRVTNSSRPRRARHHARGMAAGRLKQDRKTQRGRRRTEPDRRASQSPTRRSDSRRYT